MPSTLGGFIKGLIHLVPDLGPEVINMNSNKRKEVIRRVFEDAAKKMALTTKLHPLKP